MLTIRSSTLLKLIQLFPIITCVLVVSTTIRADPIIVSGSVTLIGNTPPFRGAPVNLVAQNFSANLFSVNGISDYLLVVLLSVRVRVRASVG
jgi:hypothetical protein